MPIYKPALAATKGLAAVALCISSSMVAAAPSQASVRPIASVPAVAVSSAAIAASLANPCTAGAQGCVLPVGQTPPPVVEVVTPVTTAYVAPAAGFNLLPLLGGAALLAGFLLLDPFDLFGEDCDISPNGDEICDDDDDDDDDDGDG